MYSRFNVKQFCQRKIRKIRHRKGYGVHSPFAYGLITKVIEEKSGYYAYKQIEDLHRTLHDRQNFNKRKCRLLFRLANRFKPRCIIECGSEKAARPPGCFVSNPILFAVQLPNNC